MCDGGAEEMELQAMSLCQRGVMRLLAASTVAPCLLWSEQRRAHDRGVDSGRDGAAGDE